jgi:hypothetical protein
MQLFEMIVNFMVPGITTESQKSQTKHVVLYNTVPGARYVVKFSGLDAYERIRASDWSTMFQPARIFVSLSTEPGP